MPVSAGADGRKDYRMAASFAASDVRNGGVLAALRLTCILPVPDENQICRLRR